MRELNVKLAAATLLLAGAVHAAQDPSIYWWRAVDGNGFIDGSQWKDYYGNFGPSGTFSAEQDYGVSWDNQLDTPASWTTDKEYSWRGRSLHLGIVDTMSGMLLLRTPGIGLDLTFANNGLFLEKGNMGSWYSGSAKIRGKVTVLASEDAPFDIWADAPDCTIDFYGPILGNGRLWLASAQDFGGSGPHWIGQTDFNCTFHVDSLKDFTGTIDVYWASHRFYNGAAHSSVTSTFVAESGSFPGHLRVDEGSQIKAAASDTSFSVNRLTLKDGAKIVVTANDELTACGRYTVAGELVAGRDLGVVLGKTASMEEVIAATDSEGKVYEVKGFKLAVLAAATGLAFPVRGFSDKVTFPGYRYLVETEASTGNSLLFVQPRATKVSRYLGITSDVGWSPSALFDATASHSSWSGGKQPAEDVGTTFLVTTPAYFRTNGEHEWLNSTFAGRSLVFACDGITLALKANATINDLILLNDAEINNLDQAGDIGTNVHFAEGKNGSPWPNYFWGNVAIADGSRLSFRCYSGKCMAIAANISGGGDLDAFSCYQWGDVSVPIGLFGDNSQLSGRIQVSKRTSSGLGANSAAQLYFREASALGGAMRSFTYNGLDLGDGAELRPMVTTTMSAENRGIYCHDSGQTDIVVPGNVAFACMQTFTLGNKLRKCGSGALVLGGDRPSFGTYGNFTPSGDENRLEVLGGTLQLVSTNAVRGLTLAMVGTGTSLIVAPAADISDGFGKYGFVNTDTETPFELSEGKLAVGFSDPEGLLSGDVRTARATAICTVSAAGAATIRGKIQLAFPEWQGLNAQVVERVNDDSSVTFVACYRKGMALIVR